MTFGYQNTQSLASFTVPASDKTLLKYYNDVSLFVRTRKPQGQILYLGEESGETLLTVRLVAGEVEVRVRVSNQEEAFRMPVAIDDGQQHFLQIIRNNTQLHVSVRQQMKTYTIISEKPLVPAVLHVGSLPTIQTGRGKRAVERQRVRRAVNRDSVEHYKGTMQDLRLNNKLLQFYPLNETGTSPPSYPPPALTNVSKGEQNDDTCAAQPCENNATCAVQFWNDFRYVFLE